MEDDIIFAMAWHLTQMARLLKMEVNRKARLLSPPTPIVVDDLNKQNQDLERKKEAEYATEVNSKLFGDDLTKLLEKSLEDAKRKKKDENE